MDLVSVDIRGARSQQRTLARVRSLIEQWQLHEEKVAAIADNDHSRLEKPNGLTLEEQPEHTPMYIALPVILERTFRNTWRQPDLFWTR